MKNRRDRLTTQILELELKMREAVIAEREQYWWPHLHGIHLEYVEPRLQRPKTAKSHADDLCQV